MFAPLLLITQTAQIFPFTNYFEKEAFNQNYSNSLITVFLKREMLSLNHSESIYSGQSKVILPYRFFGNLSLEKPARFTIRVLRVLVSGCQICQIRSGRCPTNRGNLP